MKKARISTETYRYGRDYIVDIVTDAKYYRAWIYRRNHCQKSLMFGCPRDQQTYEQFLAVVEANIPTHIEIYNHECDLLMQAINQECMREQA